MSAYATRITLSAKGLILKVVGDMVIIETADPDELRREVNRALADEPLTGQGAAGYLKVSTRTIRNWIKDGKLPAKQFNGAGYRIQKRDLEQVQTDILSPAI
jgi:excisionase family DNA binding protein